MAEPAAGRGLSDRVPGRAVREDSGRRPRTEPCDLRGDRRQPGGEQGSAGIVGGRGGRRQVLAAGADGNAEPWGAGYLHRLRGRAERISGGDRDGVSQSASAVVHRAPGAGLAELRVLETAQGGGSGPANDLSGGHGGGGLCRLEAFAEKWDWTYPTISQIGGGTGSTSDRFSATRRRSAR